MRIAMVGTGYVGLVSGTCFAEFGWNVTCLDKDESKIQMLKDGDVPIYEPGLDTLIDKQVSTKRLKFTTDLEEAVIDADALFIAVGTPPRKEDGHADMRYVYQAAREVAQIMDGYTVIVTKSTVPVGTAREVNAIVMEELEKRGNPEGVSFDICSNPEFLREGAAISDFMRPDRVVIGTDSKRAENLMRELYRPLYINETPVVATTPETAEIIKYAGNAFLATKISFINEIANLCEQAGANVQEVARGIGLDGRIGSKFLHAGPGFGGSCFPKDTLALTQIGQKHGAPQNIVETVVWVNAERQKSMADRIVAACDGNVKDKKIAILGVSFKPNTDDVRESPSLVIVPLLQEYGAQISAFDPAAMEEAAKELQDVDWCEDAYKAVKDADAVAILTEWNEFRALDMDYIGDLMKSKCLVDMRNIYNPQEMESKGFAYSSIGRSSYKAQDNETPALKSVSA